MEFQSYPQRVVLARREQGASFYWGGVNSCQSAELIKDCEGGNDFREVNLYRGYCKAKETIGEKSSFKRSSLQAFLTKLKSCNLFIYANSQAPEAQDSSCPQPPVDIEDNNSINPVPTPSDDSSIQKKETQSPSQCHSIKRKHTRTRSPSVPHGSTGIASIYMLIRAYLMVVCTCWSRGRGAMLTVLKHVFYQTSSASVGKLSPWVVACWLVFCLPQVAVASFAENPTSMASLTCEAEQHAINTTIMHRSEAYARDFDWFELVRIVVADFHLVYFGGVVLAVTCYVMYTFIGWPRCTLNGNQRRGNDGSGYDCDYYSGWLNICPTNVQGTLDTNMAVKQESQTKFVSHILVVGFHGSKEVSRSYLSTATTIAVTAPVQDSYFTQKSKGFSVIEALPSSPDCDIEDTSLSVSFEMKPDKFMNSFQPSEPVQCGQMKSVIPVANVQAAYKNSRKALNCQLSSTFLLCNQDGLALPLNLHHMKKDASKSLDDFVVQDTSNEGSCRSRTEELASDISDVTAEDGSNQSSQCCDEDFDSSDLWEFGRYGQITHATYSTSNTVFVYLSVRISQAEVNAISMSVSSSSPSDQTAHTDLANTGIKSLAKPFPLEMKVPIAANQYGFCGNMDMTHCSSDIPLQFMPPGQCPPSPPSSLCSLTGGLESAESEATGTGPQVEDYSPCCFDATTQFFVAQYEEEDDFTMNAQVN